MKTSDNSTIVDIYVNLSQQGASLIHHTSTPIAIARVNLEFLSRHLQSLVDHYRQTASTNDADTISEEHLQALLLAPTLIEEQLDVIQTKVKDHWQSISREVLGQVPDFQVATSAHRETIKNILSPNGKVNVLLVEDEAIHRSIASKVLQDSYRVDIVESGEAALIECENKCYDLILMDLYLPGLSGYEAAQKIRATNNRNAVIIGLTNMPLGNPEENEYMNGYLSKPLDTKALNSCLIKIEAVSK